LYWWSLILKAFATDSIFGRDSPSLAQAALLKKFGKSDVRDFFAEIDFRHWSRFRR
jgi:hypothetical protein